MSELTAGNRDRPWIALAQNGLPTRVGDLHAVTAIREAGTAMIRSAIEINIRLVVKNVYVYAGARAVSSKDRASKRRGGTKSGTKC